MKNPIAKFLPARFRKTHKTIPVVRLSGAIMAGGSALRPALNLANCAGLLEKAFTMKGAPAVAIVVNSPGGSPVQSRLIYQRIRDLATEHEKKVHVFVEDAAASGGYMIACAGDDITVDPSSIVGSIGVVSSSFGFVEAIEKVGVTRRVYTAGQNKSVLDPFLPEKETDIARLKDLQLEIHKVFIDLVKESRGDRLVDDEDMFTGLFWTGGRGKDLGLVDAIGDLRGTLKAKYGKDTKLRLIEKRQGLFGRRSAFGLDAGAFALQGDCVGRAAVAATETAFATLEEKALWARLGL
ncbi:MAG: S49 family peptidase [Pseudomonadota bacterium]